VKQKRYLSIDAELNELFDWQHKARFIGYVALAVFLLLNITVWSAELIPQHDILKFLLISALFCFGGYVLYRLNFHLERLVVHTLVIRKELVDLEGALEDKEAIDRDGPIGARPLRGSTSMSDQVSATK
jgi:hypothetical protein